MNRSLCSKMTRRDFILSLQDQHCHSALSLLQAAPGQRGRGPKPRTQQETQEETDARS
jgi:hypothetical protein